MCFNVTNTKLKLSAVRVKHEKRIGRFLSCTLREQEEYKLQASAHNTLYTKAVAVTGCWRSRADKHPKGIRS